MRAHKSAENDLTLIIQDVLQPYEKRSRAPKAKEIAIHTLQWPKKDLLELGSVNIELRITLSYFVEPNPSARGYKERYGYASHALRFKVSRPGELDGDFKERVNEAWQDEDHESVKDPQDSKRWKVGFNGRHRGSIHTDVWEGAAADLADLDRIAVFPISGWWKYRVRFKRYERKVRYALIVSIRAPEQNVDLYTPIMTQIESAQAIKDRQEVEVSR
ncbi:MAG: hypothetical protein HQL53_15040 [Magnetococcales bacterium]|nr:hypothetical protein [Magnetococcales bacterium]